MIPRKTTGGAPRPEGQSERMLHAATAHPQYKQKERHQRKGKNSQKK